MKCAYSGFLFLLLCTLAPALKVDAVSISVKFCIGQLILGKLMAEHMQSPDFSRWSAGLVNGPAGDDDGDGLSNGLKFFLGTNPNTPDNRSAGPICALLCWMRAADRRTIS